MRTPTRTLSYVLAAALAATFTACSSDGDGDPDPDPDPDPVPTYTWHQDVAPIVAEHCQGCHQAGGIAPFSLVEYDDAWPIAQFMWDMVEKGAMPPWSAVSQDDCEHRYDWRDDPRLSEDKKEILRVWAEEGGPEGDPENPAQLPEPPSTDLPRVTHTLAPDNAYATSGFTDELVCMVLDPELTQANWLTGMQIRPGNLEVVHHATVSVVPPDARADVEARVGPDGTFECFGGVGIEGAYLLGVWVPGSMPFLAPTDVGVPIAADSVLVMQIHYHPTGLMHDPDLTEIDMELTSQFPGNNMIYIGFGNAPFAPILQPGPNDTDGVEFRIPAGVPDHTEKMVFTLETESTQRFPIVAAFPHMHYVGVDLKTTITRAETVGDEPVSECLMTTPNWDFEWQRTYIYDAPLDELPTIGNGDTIEIECGYDNTVNNPGVRQGMLEMGLDEPVDVYLGEETLDEMCLIAFAIIF